MSIAFLPRCGLLHWQAGDYVSLPFVLTLLYTGCSTDCHLPMQHVVVSHTAHCKIALLPKVWGATCFYVNKKQMLRFLRDTNHYKKYNQYEIALNFSDSQEIRGKKKVRNNCAQLSSAHYFVYIFMKKPNKCGNSAHTATTVLCVPIVLIRVRRLHTRHVVHILHQRERRSSDDSWLIALRW